MFQDHSISDYRRHLYHSLSNFFTDDCFNINGDTWWTKHSIMKLLAICYILKYINVILIKAVISCNTFEIHCFFHWNLYHKTVIILFIFYVNTRPVIVDLLILLSVMDFQMCCFCMLWKGKHNSMYLSFIMSLSITQLSEFSRQKQMRRGLWKTPCFSIKKA